MQKVPSRQLQLFPVLGFVSFNWFFGAEALAAALISIEIQLLNLSKDGIGSEGAMA